MPPRRATPRHLTPHIARAGLQLLSPVVRHDWVRVRWAPVRSIVVRQRSDFTARLAELPRGSARWQTPMQPAGTVKLCTSSALDQHLALGARGAVADHLARALNRAELTAADERPTISPPSPVPACTMSPAPMRTTMQVTRRDANPIASARHTSGR